MTHEEPLPLALVAALLPACASTSAAPAFRDTARLVEARTGHRIFWNQGGAADDAVARRIHELLSRDLSVDAAIQIALLNNEELQALYEDLSVAQADLVQAGLLQNPTFSGGVTYRSPAPGADGLRRRRRAGFPAALHPRRRARRSRAPSSRPPSFASATPSFAATFDVQSAYYTLVAAQQMLEHAPDGARRGRRGRDAGRGAARGGQHQRPRSRQRTDALPSSFGRTSQRSEADVVGAREALTRLLGLWGPDLAFRAPSRCPIRRPPTSAARAPRGGWRFGRRLDLASAHERPRPSRSRGHGQELPLRRARQRRAWRFERSPGAYSAITPEARWSCRIFDQKQAADRAPGRPLRQAQAREGALAVDIRSEVRVAQRAPRSRCGTSWIATRRSSSRCASRVVELSQQQYGAMLLGASQLLAAKQNELSAYREFIEALRDYWIARADLERAGRCADLRPAAPTPGAHTMNAHRDTSST